jgi:hypothetical protein
VIFRDGVPVAWSIGASVGYAAATDPIEQRRLRDTLVRRQAVPASDDLP